MPKTIVLYSASELKEDHPEGFERALNHWKNEQDEIVWMDETIESLKALIKASGLYLRDWSLGPEAYRSYIKIDWKDDTADLSGQRALAWLENNLLADLREKRKFVHRVKRYEHDGNKPHVYTRYGKIPECPLTGYWADEYFLEHLIKDLKDDATLQDAYSWLADACAKLLEEELENQMSEEYFIDHAEANEFQFTEDGQRVY